MASPHTQTKPGNFKFDPNREPMVQCNIKLKQSYLNQLRVEAATAKMSLTSYLTGLLHIVSPPAKVQVDPKSVLEARQQLEQEKEAAKTAKAIEKAQTKASAKRAKEDAGREVEPVDQPNLALVEFFEEES